MHKRIIDFLISKSHCLLYKFVLTKKNFVSVFFVCTKHMHIVVQLDWFVLKLFSFFFDLFSFFQHRLRQSEIDVASCPILQFLPAVPLCPMCLADRHGSRRNLRIEFACRTRLWCTHTPGQQCVNNAKNCSKEFTDRAISARIVNSMRTKSAWTKCLKTVQAKRPKNGRRFLMTNVWTIETMILTMRMTIQLRTWSPVMTLKGKIVLALGTPMWLSMDMTWMKRTKKAAESWGKRCCPELIR